MYLPEKIHFVGFNSVHSDDNTRKVRLGKLLPASFLKPLWTIPEQHRPLLRTSALSCGRAASAWEEARQWRVLTQKHLPLWTRGSLMQIHSEVRTKVGNILLVVKWNPELSPKYIYLSLLLKYSQIFVFGQIQSWEPKGSERQRLDPFKGISCDVNEVGHGIWKIWPTV